MYGSWCLSAPPSPSWQNVPPQVGEGCRDHMTLPQGLGQLLDSQLEPRAEKGLAFEPCSSMAAVLLASSFSFGSAWPGRAHFCPLSTNKKLLLYWAPWAEIQCCVVEEGVSCVRP